MRVSGGGIHKASFSALNGGTLAIVDSEVTDNSAHQGGGITINGASPPPHTITRTVIARNSADRLSASSDPAMGGGVFVAQGLLQVVDSLIESNTAFNTGGGIHAGNLSNFAGTLLVIGSTISDNSARAGGGVYLLRGGEIRQSTIARNAADNGAGVYAAFPTTIDQSTLSENVANQAGGGIYIAASTLQLNHSILAGNTSQFTGVDIGRGSTGNLSAKSSLIGESNGSGLPEAARRAPDVAGNLIGGPTHGPIDPGLRPFADYGGLFHTYALDANSAAVNSGDPARQPGSGGVPLYDQRGVPFHRVIDGRIDIGAVEFQGPIAHGLVVDTLADESDGDYSPGDLSLREALQLANAVPGESIIQFAPALTASGPATILLTRGELRTVDSVKIQGPGRDLLTIDASGNDPTPDVHDSTGSRVFNVDVPDSTMEVSLFGLTLTGGDTDYGGGVLSNGKLTIAASTISGNHASEIGGGVVGVYGSLHIEISTISDNETMGTGGGVAVAYSDLEIIDSIVSDNVAGNGGGIHAFESNVVIHGSVINENTATDSIGQGGGIFHHGAELTVVKSKISGNTAASGGGVYSNNSVTILQTAITSNHARRGGGIYSFGHLTLRGSTLSGNSAGFEGGAINARGEVAIHNSTISGNSGNSGGGMWLDLSEGSATVEHSTVFQNAGGGVAAPFGSVLLDHTIVAGNYIAGGGSLDVDGVVNARFSLIGAGAQFLGPLVNNGGPTPTHALLPGSPAINAGDPSAVAGEGGVPLYDQRGEPFGRVFVGRIDIGAFERRPNSLPGDYNFNGVVDSADSIVWRETRGSTTDLRADGNEDGVVDDADRAIWMANFGKTRAGELVIKELGLTSVRGHQPPVRTEFNYSAVAAEQAAPGDALCAVNPAVDVSSVRPAYRSAKALANVANPAILGIRQDAALVAWLASHTPSDAPRDDTNGLHKATDGRTEATAVPSAYVLDCAFRELSISPQ